MPITLKQSVDMETMLIVGNHVSQQPNDKQEVEPALAQLDQLPENLGKVEKAALDSGFFSEYNTNCLEGKGIEPYIAAGRHTHNLSLEERLAPPPSLPQNPDAVAAMKHRLKTEAGKEFYAKRKSTVEPVFGIIKEVMGFRRFMLRGQLAVTGEWTLVCIAFNLKRLCRRACVNNQKSDSKIRSGAIAMVLDCQKTEQLYCFFVASLLLDVKEFLSPTDS